MEKITILGMELDQWIVDSCLARFATNDQEKWATLYDIHSLEQGKGHATKLLRKAKRYYEKLGYEVGGSVALNDRMARLYKKVGYKVF